MRLLQDVLLVLAMLVLLPLVAGQVSHALKGD